MTGREENIKKYFDVAQWKSLRVTEEKAKLFKRKVGFIPLIRHWYQLITNTPRHTCSTAHEGVSLVWCEFK